MARANRAELIVSHVMSPIVITLEDAYISLKTYEDMAASARACAQRQIDALVAKAWNAGARARGVLLEGVAIDRLARPAKGSTSTSWRRAPMDAPGCRFLIGSVAERLIRDGPAPCNDGARAVTAAAADIDRGAELGRHVRALLRLPARFTGAA